MVVVGGGVVFVRCIQRGGGPLLLTRHAPRRRGRSANHLRDNAIVDATTRRHKLKRAPDELVVLRDGRFMTLLEVRSE